MQTKRTHWILGPLFGLVLASCGGGGGGGGSTPPPPATTITAVTTAPMTFTGVPTVLSVTINPLGPVTWSATGGTINGGTATSVNFTPPATPGVYRVTAASARDRSKFVTFDVVAVSSSAAILKGSVKAGGVGVSGVGIRLLSASGAVVKTVSSGSKGTFAIAVSPTAKLFNVNGASIPVAYYQSFQYKGDWFTAIESSCKGALPTLTAGKIATGLDITLAGSTGAPPPPPTGCR